MNRFLYYIIIFLLVLPSLQRLTSLVPVPPLDGDFKVPERPVFSKTDWWSGQFQSAYQEYIENKTGFRKVLVRLNHQIDFSLFSEANAEGIVIGRNNNLFEKDYIRAYLGGDYIGDVAIDKKIRRLKFLQELLKKKGKDLILVFEPGKASYQSEDIPERFYRQYPPSKTNYQAFLESSVKYGIHYLDFNDWFKKMKPKTEHPLYANTGIHWSHYGMYLAADSLIRYLENLRGMDLAEMVLDRWEVSNEARGSEYDAARALNLLMTIRNQQLAYPVFHFEHYKEKKKISVLTVADSYYWNIYNTRLPLHLFNNEAFWYFNAKVYPDTYHQPIFTESLNIIEEVEKQDVIFLMVTERFLYKFDWGFIDRLFEAYTPELLKDEPYLYEGKIKGYSEWFDNVEIKAKNSGISISEALTRDALYTWMNENRAEYMLYFGTDHYIQNICGDRSWYEQEKLKSEEKKKNLKDVIEQDADYLFFKEYPELHNKYHAIQAEMDAIRRDKPQWIKILKNPYYLRPEDMLWQVASARVNQGPQSLALMSW